MDKVICWIEEHDPKGALDYSSILILSRREFDIDLSGYIVTTIDEGKRLFETLDKMIRSTCVEGKDRKRVIFIENAATLDKGFQTGMKTIMKQRYKHSVPIIVDVLEDENMEQIFMRRCQVIREERRDNKHNTTMPIKRYPIKKQQIELYKKRLLVNNMLLN